MKRIRTQNEKEKKWNSRSKFRLFVRGFQCFGTCLRLLNEIAVKQSLYSEQIGNCSAPCRQTERISKTPRLSRAEFASRRSRLVEYRKSTCGSSLMLTESITVAINTRWRWILDGSNLVKVPWTAVISDVLMRKKNCWNYVLFWNREQQKACSENNGNQWRSDWGNNGNQWHSQEGTTEISDVSTQGTAKISNVHTQGITEISDVPILGTTEISDVPTQGTAEANEINVILPSGNNRNLWSSQLRTAGISDILF